MPESRKRKKQTASPVELAPTDTPQSPRWWAPTMVTLMVLGLLWVVATYLGRGEIPVPGIGNWNLLIGFGIMMAGFLMTLRWR